MGYSNMYKIKAVKQLRSEYASQHQMEVNRIIKQAKKDLRIQTEEV